METLVTQFFSGGGFQSLISAVLDNMDEQTINNLGQVAGENVQQQLANMDVSNRQIWTKITTKTKKSNWPCDKYDHYIPRWRG